MNYNKRKEEIITILKDNPNITLQQITKRLRLTAISNVHYKIKKMIDSGDIKKVGRSFIVREDIENPISYIPYYGSAQCGPTDILSDEEIKDYIPMPTKFLPGNPDNLFFMKAQGDSMEPTIKEGAMLLFKKWDGLKPKPNDIILCFQGEGCKIKRFLMSSEGPKLVSDNKAKYDPIILNPDDYTKIIGKLVTLES